jgi:hypothetical protein
MQFIRLNLPDKGVFVPIGAAEARITRSTCSRAWTLRKCNAHALYQLFLCQSECIEQGLTSNFFAIFFFSTANLSRLLFRA